jgi:hypothetical protein
MRYDIILAIDPDVEQSGVARLDVTQRKSWADTLPFPMLIEYIRQVYRTNLGKSIAVVVEASWHKTHNWHLNRRDTLGIAAKKGYDEGRNHEAGRKIIEMLNYYGIEVIEKEPLRKIWKGPDGKITHTEITAITGWEKKRSNQEERDAMLLAWDRSGLPIRIARQ